MKKCSKCKEDRSLDRFGKDRYTSDGLKYTCRECINKQRREINRRKKLEKLSKIPPGTKKCSFCCKYITIEFFGKCSSHRDNLASYCKPCKKIKDKEYNVDNIDKTLVQRKKYKDKIAKSDKIYREKNKESIATNKRKYYLDNRGYFIEKSKEYSKNKYNNDINYRIASNLRGRLYKSLHGNFKNGSAVRDLGCSVDELKKHLENLFYIHLQTGKPMTWKNYGIDGWHIDHIKPLSSFNLSDAKQVKIACHYTNLQPLWAEDNLRKGARII